jgi:hypothetical protein
MNANLARPAVVAWLVSLFGIFTMATNAQAATPRLEIGQRPAEAWPASAIVLPVQALPPAAVRDAPPTFSFRLPGDKADTVHGWVTLTLDALSLEIDVEDDIHVNSYREDQPKGEVTRGDRLLVGLDTTGDGNRNFTARREAAFPPLVEADVSPTMDPFRAGGGRADADDLLLAVALTPEGVRVLRAEVGPGRTGRDWVEAEAWGVEVTRDAEAERTRYRLRLPWASLNTRPGESAVFGLSVEIGDSDAQGTMRRGLWPVDDHAELSLDINRWGRKFGSHRFALGVWGPMSTSPGPRLAATVTAPILWRPDGAVEVTVAYAVPRDLRLEARMGDGLATWRLPPDTNGGEFQRVVVRANPGDRDDLTLDLTVLDPQAPDAPPLLQREVPLARAYVEHEALQARLLELADRAEHPLFARHLVSMRLALATMWTWAEASQRGSSSPHAPRDRVADLLSAFTRGDADAWASYVDRRYPLILATEPDPHGLVGWARVWLPKAWSPDQPYPLTMYLEGTSHGNVTAFFRDDHPEPIEVRAAHVPELSFDEHRHRYPGYQRRPEILEGQGYAVHPSWTHLNRPALLAVLERDLGTDPDRWYAYGHSHGAYAAFRPYTSRWPDRFAAVGLSGLVGFQDICRDEYEWTARGPDTSLMANLAANVAVMVLLDQHEARYVTPEIVTRLLEQAGVRHRVEVMQTTRHHDWHYRRMKRITDWLLQQRRVTPTAFTYLSYGNRPKELGAWGLQMAPCEAFDLQDRTTWPYLSAAVEGQSLHIETRNTDRLRVDPAPLGLSGEPVVVHWNGRRFESDVDRFDLHAMPSSPASEP